MFTLTFTLHRPRHRRAGGFSSGWQGSQACPWQPIGRLSGLIPSILATVSTTDGDPGQAFMDEAGRNTHLVCELNLFYHACAVDTRGKGFSAMHT